MFQVFLDRGKKEAITKINLVVAVHTMTIAENISISNVNY